MDAYYTLPYCAAKGRNRTHLVAIIIPIVVALLLCSYFFYCIHSRKMKKARGKQSTWSFSSFNLLIILAEIVDSLELFHFLAKKIEEVNLDYGLVRTIIKGWTR